VINLTNFRAEELHLMHQLALNFASVPKSSRPQPKVDPAEVPSAPVSDPDYSRIFASPTDFANCLEPSWRGVLEAEFRKPYFETLLESIRKETREVFPPKQDVLNAFKFCPFNNVKVVIIGQDPYHDVGQAHGLSFSVRRGVTIPPSLKNMYKELADEYPSNFTIPKHGYLENWAKQGVLLLNAALTVAAHNANSHAKLGWSNFTAAVVAAINKHLDGVVFLAWGNYAQGLCKGLNTTKHFLLKSGHPSPLSQKLFFGCGHFAEANRLLAKKDKTPVNWNAVND
jgi:uracil-DNA glycosylase